TQSDKSEQVKSRRLVQHRVVIEPGEQHHPQYAQRNPAQLFPLHSGQMAGVGGGPDFEQTHAANGKRDGKKPPVVIRCTRAALHGCKFGFRASDVVGMIAAVGSGLTSDLPVGCGLAISAPPPAARAAAPRRTDPGGSAWVVSSSGGTPCFLS